MDFDEISICSIVTSHEIFLNFSTKLWLLIDVKISIFINNEWILITFCLCIGVHVYVLRKVGIGTILELSCTKWEFSLRCAIPEW